MADQVVQGSEKTGLIFKDLMLSVDRLANKLLPEGAGSPGKAFNITDYTDAMRQLDVTTEKLNALLDNTSEKLAVSILDDLNTTAEKRVDHIFYRLVQLCLVVGLIVLILIFVNNRIRQKPAGQKLA
jgi:hypothetical protein